MADTVTGGIIGGGAGLILGCLVAPHFVLTSLVVGTAIGACIGKSDADIERYNLDRKRRQEIERLRDELKELRAERLRCENDPVVRPVVSEWRSAGVKP